MYSSTRITGHSLSSNPRFTAVLSGYLGGRLLKRSDIESWIWMLRYSVSRLLGYHLSRITSLAARSRGLLLCRVWPCTGCKRLYGRTWNKHQNKTKCIIISQGTEINNIILWSIGRKMILWYFFQISNCWGLCYKTYYDRNYRSHDRETCFSVIKRSNDQIYRDFRAVYPIAFGSGFAECDVYSILIFQVFFI